MSKLEDILTLRKDTGATVSDCKNALEKSAGDIKKAKKLLGFLQEDCPASKVPVGIVQSYIHHNHKVGAMVEIHCETDSVANNLMNFAREICMQIAATSPEYMSERDVPKHILDEERKLHAAFFNVEGHEKKEVTKLVKGRMKKFYFDHCLLGQKYVQDTRITIRDLINNKIRETGEKIKVVRFARFQVDK